MLLSEGMVKNDHEGFETEMYLDLERKVVWA